MDKDNKDTNDFFSSYGICIIVALIILIGLYIFKEFIFLNKLCLYKDIGSDSINYSYPSLVHISDYLRNEGFPGWSFNQGMGQNILPFSLGNPFDWILYALGRQYLAYGIAYVELLKIALGGLFFFLYLKTIELTTYASIVGGVLFAFSGFMILGSNWSVFSTEAVHASLMLFSFERLFINKSWGIFPISVALIAAFQPFNLYLYGTFLLIYAAFRHIDIYGWKPKELSILLCKMAGLGLLGLLISSFLLFSNVVQLIESPRVGGDASYYSRLSSTPAFAFGSQIHNITAIMRFFSNDMLGTGSNYHGWDTYLAAPNFYHGLLCLLLIPQAFVFLCGRKRVLYFALTTIWIIPIMFPFFRYAFWLFTGNYYRASSFFVVLVSLFLGLQSLSNIDKSRKINIPLLLVTLVVLLGFLYYPYKEIGNLIDQELRTTVTAFLFVYAGLIYIFSRNEHKTMVRIALLVVLSIELSYLSSIMVNKRSILSVAEYKQKVGYNDYTNDAVSYLNKTDKSFYRIDKYYSSGPAIHASLNDAKIQNFKGTSSYYSFNQINYIKFLEELDIIHTGLNMDERATRWVMGLRGRTFLETIASVKYNLAKEGKETFLQSGYEYIARFGDVMVFRNQYYLPLGYTYERFMTNRDFLKLPVYKRDVALLKAFVINDQEREEYKDFAPVTASDIPDSYTWEPYKNDTENLKKDILEISEHGQNHVKGDIALEKTKLLFFSIPYDKGWTAKVDGKAIELKKINIGFMGLMIHKGKHTIELTYKPPYLAIGTTISTLSLLLYLFLAYKLPKA